MNITKNRRGTEILVRGGAGGARVVGRGQIFFFFFFGGGGGGGDF